MTYSITEDMLPCIISSCTGNTYKINKITDRGCFYNDTWVCMWDDNPQLIITFAELYQYFPERCI